MCSGSNKKHQRRFTGKGVLTVILCSCRLFCVQEPHLSQKWWYTNHFHITECSWSKLAWGKWYLRVNSIWRPYLKMIDHLILFWQWFFAATSICHWNTNSEIWKPNCRAFQVFVNLHLKKKKYCLFLCVPDFSLTEKKIYGKWCEVNRNRHCQ